MYQKAQKENCDNASGTCSDITHLHIEDYVDYKNPTSGTVEVTSAESGVYGKDSDGNSTVNIIQTYTLSTTKNNVKWRALGIDSETGGLKLIAADPIERDENSSLSVMDKAAGNDPYLYLVGAEAYVYGPTVLNKVGAMYLNSIYATKARSVTMEDVNEITGVTTADKIKEVNLDAYDGNKNYGETYSYSNHYTPELWLQIGKKQDSTKATTVSGTVDGYYYSINSKNNENAPSVTMTNTRVYDMLFKDVERRTQKAYWLASRGVSAILDRACFEPGHVRSGNGVTYADIGYDLFSSDGDGYGRGLAVRPVVILKSDVMETDAAKIVDQASTWTYVADTSEDK